MTERELRKWMHWDGLADCWRRRRSSGEFSAPATLAEHLDRAAPGVKTLALLHESQVKAKEPAWVEVDVASRLPSGERDRHVRRRRRRRSRIGWQLLGVTVLLLVVVGLYWGSLDHGSEEPVIPVRQLTEAEQVQAMIEQARKNITVNESTEKSPTLSVFIAKGESIIYLTNTGSQPWPKVDIWLNGRFRCADASAGLVLPAKTLKVPLRLFVDEVTGERYVDSGTRASRIRVEVPGWETWEDRF